MMNNAQSRQAPDPTGSSTTALERERYALLQRLENWLDVPMTLLAFAWLALLVVELVHGEGRLFDIAGLMIWGIFTLNFAIEFAIAPRKVPYLRRNWLKALSLFAPGLRVLRVARLLQAGRAGRGLLLLRVLGSLNRSMDALTASLKRRGFGYVVTFTIAVTFSGAAAMYAFEQAPRGNLTSYWDALWWTAMVMTTMGSQEWPQTAEGRILCIFLALYAFAVFGYVTATLATFFIGRDADADDAELAGARQLAALREEIVALRAQLETLAPRPSPPPSGAPEGSSSL